jgi:hypothetical protein
VCRRWRSVIFQSPHRLNLRLVCTHKTPVRDTLEVWPPLPLIIRIPCGFVGDWDRNFTRYVKNIVAALERNDRVCQIQILEASNIVTNLAEMQKPFPELVHLRLFASMPPPPGSILPNSFLGGTAPCLRSLKFSYIPFPGLPKLLSSATHLVKLDLYEIPPSGYIPPEEMATSLSALTNLEFLYLGFLCPRLSPTLERRRPHLPPLTRSVLPSLTEIEFRGASEYLEEILARIDAPRLEKLRIHFFNQITFDTPQLFQFINRSPTLRAPEEGCIKFNAEAILAKFPYGVAVSVGILCTELEWQLSSLEQVCTSSLPLLSLLEDLVICKEEDYLPDWEDDVENTLWLDLLRSFVAVKNLYLSEDFAPCVAPAMQDLVEGRTTEVLPALENIFLEGPPEEGIEMFVAARQLTNRPVTVSHWDRDLRVDD